MSPAILVNLNTEELKNFCHIEREMSVLQRVTVSSSTGLTPLCGSWLVWTVFMGRIRSPSSVYTYIYHFSSAKDRRFVIYFKWQTSPSLPFSFDSIPVSLHCLVLTSNFLFSGTLAAIRLLVCSCHFFFLHLSLSVIPAFNQPLIHTSYKQTSLLLLCCP